MSEARGAAPKVSAVLSVLAMPRLASEGGQSKVLYLRTLLGRIKCMAPNQHSTGLLGGLYLMGGDAVKGACGGLVQLELR